MGIRYVGWWVLNLGDGGDAIHVGFVEILSAAFFSNRESKVYWEFKRGLFYWKIFIGGICKFFILSF